MSKEPIEKRLTEMANAYAALRGRSDSEERRKVVIRKAITMVFAEYCLLIWNKERIKNAGLEISITIKNVFSSFNPDKGCFINFLNNALSHAINDGCKNAVQGSENNYKIQKESSIKDSFDKPILDSLADKTTRPQNIESSKTEKFLCELNRLFLKENQKHRHFLSEWLTWKIIDELDTEHYESILNHLDFYNKTFVLEHRQNADLNQDFIAKRNGLKKDNACHIIKRFAAKIDSDYKELLQ